MYQHPSGTVNDRVVVIAQEKKLVAKLGLPIMVGKNCIIYISGDRLCGLVVRVSGYRYRGPGFDSRRFQIF
jgi:hypothetical protein